MKHNVIKKTMVSLCAFALCAGLTACSENQEKNCGKIPDFRADPGFCNSDELHG